MTHACKTGFFVLRSTKGSLSSVCYVRKSKPDRLSFAPLRIKSLSYENHHASKSRVARKPFKLPSTVSVMRLGSKKSRAML
jgi:hypothetical protein